MGRSHKKLGIKRTNDHAFRPQKEICPENSSEELHEST
jgi:hypothetical protein